MSTPYRVCPDCGTTLTAAKYATARRFTRSNEAPRRTSRRFSKRISPAPRGGAAGMVKTTGFFTAPASTKYHGNYEGGLVKHSLNVFERIRGRLEFTPETRAICGLLHDVCKANFYAVDYKNQKNAAGTWERVPFYTVKDQFPFGHGEKSVFLIERFMNLTNKKALAIR